MCNFQSMRIIRIANANCSIYILSKKKLMQLQKFRSLDHKIDIFFQQNNTRDIMINKKNHILPFLSKQYLFIYSSYIQLYNFIIIIKILQYTNVVYFQKYISFIKHHKIILQIKLLIHKDSSDQMPPKKKAQFIVKQLLKTKTLQIIEQQSYHANEVLKNMPIVQQKIKNIVQISPQQQTLNFEIIQQSNLSIEQVQLSNNIVKKQAEQILKFNNKQLFLHFQQQLQNQKNQNIKIPVQRQIQQNNEQNKNQKGGQNIIELSFQKPEKDQDNEDNCQNAQLKAASIIISDDQIKQAGESTILLQNEPKIFTNGDQTYKNIFGIDIQKQISHPLYNKYKQILKQSDQTFQNRLIKFGSSITRIQNTISLNSGQKQYQVIQKQTTKYHKKLFEEKNLKSLEPPNKQIDYNKNNYHNYQNYQCDNRNLYNPAKINRNYEQRLNKMNNSTNQRCQDYKKWQNRGNYNNSYNNGHEKVIKQYKNFGHSYQNSDRNYKLGQDNKKYYNSEDYHRSRDQKYYKHKVNFNDSSKYTERPSEFQRIKPNPNFLKRYIRPYVSSRQQTNNNKN